LLGELIEHCVLVLPRYMKPEDLLLHLFATLCAFKKLLSAKLFHMELEVTFLDKHATSLRALNFKLINDLLEAHICLELHRQLHLAEWTTLRVAPQRIEACLTYDVTALITVKWNIRELITYLALKILKSDALLL